MGIYGATPEIRPVILDPDPSGRQLKMDLDSMPATPNNPLPILIIRKAKWKRYFASGWKWGVLSNKEKFEKQYFRGLLFGEH